MSGQVVDRQSSEPVPFANIILLEDKSGVACDSSGKFTINLPAGNNEIQIESIGYKSKNITLKSELEHQELFIIYLDPIVLQFSDEIIVYGTRDQPSMLEKNAAKWLNATDDIMEKTDGVDMLRRGNFALQPSISGMRDGQIGMVIDGMKIFSACVDQMDPVSVYIEVENLKKLQVSRGAFDLTNSQGSGGTINFITHKPDFDKKLQFEFEGGYESASNLRRVRGIFNFADSSYALRATYSAKDAADFYAGNKTQIKNSGYHKENYKFDIVKKLGQNHRLDASYIGDNAWDIGYPVLLMDATKTKSQIFNIGHNWSPNWSLLNSLNTKLYYNKIDHWMDDFNRDVSQRPVMTNMYMPMYGNTKTMGFIVQSTSTPGNQLLRLTLDYYRLRAFADMDMISIFPDVSPAYMINLADVSLDNFAIVLDYHWQTSKSIIMRTNLRFDQSRRNLFNDFGKKQLMAFWKGKSPSINYSVFSASTVFEYSMSNGRVLNLSLARGERMPTHIENYGYFLYNIMDGYFYIGNPYLRSEKSYQIDLGLKRINSDFTYRINFFYNFMQDYILGILQPEEYKIFSNVDMVYIWGTLVNLNLFITQNIGFSASGTYTHGQNHTFREPLPLISPFNGTFSISYQIPNYWFTVGANWAFTQSRIAYRTTLEDQTNSYVSTFFRGRIDITKSIELKFGVENIFDVYYHHHLSINNLPNRGRNIYLGVNIELE